MIRGLIRRQQLREEEHPMDMLIPIAASISREPPRGPVVRLPI